MASLLALLAQLFLAAQVCHASSRGSTVQQAQAQVTPIQQVVDMLGDMVAKGKKEKHEEEVEFAKFHEWCDSTRATTAKSIEEAKADIEQLGADIAKAGADAEELAEDIKELQGSTAQAEGELKEANGLREKEHADYSATHADISESVDAIERAIDVLKSREADVPQSLLQVQSSPRIPHEAKVAIAAFLALSWGSGSESSELQGVPEANAYESQSGGVVSMLEKLRLKFQDQRVSLEKEELSSRHNFEKLAQKLSDNIKEDKKRAAKKTSTRAQRLADAATATADLKTTEAAKAEDEKTLADTLAACHARSEEFEKNQVVRAEEAKAIGKAVAILMSDEVSGTADKHLPSLIQAATALAQLRGNESPEEAQFREHLVEFLHGRAEKSGSTYLSLVATHASADPFAKVKNMIQGLVVKLMEQANAEADHKGYCDTELGTNQQTREIKTSEVDELSSRIEQSTTDSAQLAEEIAGLSDALAELQRQQAEATKNRGAEKATNARTAEEAKAAQAAVERATQVLKEFYGKAVDAAMLQGGSGLGQEMAQEVQAPYRGMQSESGGIMGFLEVILSDFARLESETNTAEDQAAAAYQKFMDESNQDIAVKETEKGHKEDRRQQTDEAIAGLRQELKLTQGELDAALAYYEKLKPDCVDQKLSFSDRAQMREEEIQSLQEALKILAQEDLD